MTSTRLLFYNADKRKGNRMLDERDLQAIAKLISASEVRMTALIKEEVGASEARMTALIKGEVGASETRMTEKINDAEGRMMALMEGYFKPEFNLLGEQLQLIQEKILPSEALEDLEDRVDVLEAAVKQHSRELELLKKAQ